MEESTIIIVGGGQAVEGGSFTPLYVNIFKTVIGFVNILRLQLETPLPKIEHYPHGSQKRLGYNCNRPGCEDLEQQSDICEICGPYPPFLNTLFRN